MEKLEFCGNCREYVKYEIKEVNSKFKMKHKPKVKYKERIAVCKKCGARIYIAEIIDGNLERLKEAIKNKGAVK